jgi:DNA-binding CsgD family transcriptional regulator
VRTFGASISLNLWNTNCCSIWGSCSFICGVGCQYGLDSFGGRCPPPPDPSIHWTITILSGRLFLMPDPLACLTPKEVIVFWHLINGLRAKEIADRLEISPKTVDIYRARLMRKLYVLDLVSLVKFGIEHNRYADGLAPVPSVIRPRLPHRPSKAVAAERPHDADFKIE